tara:strand:+ start:346 stop:531 length:186 start_codon:yes stop_codon:yes gene_type:complete
LRILTQVATCLAAQNDSVLRIGIIMGFIKDTGIKKGALNSAFGFKYVCLKHIFLGEDSLDN